jgi:hypothetical protein
MRIAEVECLRLMLHECCELLYRNGHLFPKGDREKAINILAKIKTDNRLKVISWTDDKEPREWI